jgi:DNA-binding SARP family transcriptional activator
MVRPASTGVVVIAPRPFSPGAGPGGKQFTAPSLAGGRPETVTVAAVLPALEISLLGPPRVSRAGTPVGFDTRKATALLAHLALAGAPRSREALCALLWPGQDPEHARGALRRTLSALRKAVGEEWIDAAAGSVALRDGAGLDIDVRRFRALASPDATPEELASAVDVFTGELLEGFSLRDNSEFDAWYVYEADALQRELGAALGRLVVALGERGEYGRAIPYARRWLAVDPLHEPAHRELIRLYALAGDRAAALAQYRECVRTLSQELGVPPVDETAALFEQVSEGRLVAPSRQPPARPRAVTPPTELPLVGRGDELAALIPAHAAAAPDGRLAVVEGEAGIGKTRLSRELMAAVGGPVLAARCHDDEAGLPYGPVVELLAEALRAARQTIADTVPAQRLADASLLLPELATLRPDTPAPTAMTGPAAQARLLEGIAAVLGAAGGESPALVFVDDVHAADAATQDVLAYLGRRLRGRPLLLLLAWRRESVPPGHRLRRLTTELSRSGAATVVTLARLDEGEVAELVRSVEPQGAPELERRVYVESEGLPLFVAEYLAAMAAGGEGEGPMPGELRDLLASRVAGLGGTSRQLLETAAVIGRSFGLDIVRSASGRSDDEAVDGLDDLVGRGLVRELAATDLAYDFTHEKLRALVYEQTGRARRRLLHRRVADALLRGSASAATVAQHLRLAGDHAGAAEQHRIAAEHAASVLAHREALDHLDAALALGGPDPAMLHERMGDLRTLVGDYSGALSSYESAAAECGPGDLARVEHKLGGVHQRRGEWDRAQARFAVALEALALEEAGLRARILTDLGLTLHHAGSPGRAAALAAEARALAESAGDRRALAQAHNVLGMLARESGEPDRALALTEEALTLCAGQGDRHREAALENNLADLHHAAGRNDEAMTHLKRAVAIFSEVGGDERARLPEVWKLVSW